jgi:carboxypeptidase D
VPRRFWPSVWLTKSSYYVPYVADAFITAADDKYYKLGGVAINDPILGDGVSNLPVFIRMQPSDIFQTIQQQVVIMPYVEYWKDLFNLNETYYNALQGTHSYCNYSSYLEEYFTFPPKDGPIPVLPDPYATEDPNSNYTCDMFDYVYSAAIDANPCFNIYHITDTCPFVYSHMGIVNPGDYDPPGSEVYFNRTDVKKALNAPVDSTWYQCTPENVFNYGYENNYTLGDTSLGPAQNDILQRVIEYNNNTIIGVGNLDFLLAPNGTLFAMQNVTWNGKQGFQKYPQDKLFYVPYHPEYNGGRLSESGYVGAWGKERGVTFYTVQLAGHELPGYSAGSGYRVLELLLGRIKSLGEIEDFTTQTGDFGNNGSTKTNGFGNSTMRIKY